MPNDTITLAEGMEIMNARDSMKMLVPFNISYRTFSKDKHQGGTLKVYEGVTYLPAANKKSDSSERFPDRKYTRNPNHHDNHTRNIELANGQIKTVYIDFIISINGKDIIY